jgi:hypothetical protein
MSRLTEWEARQLIFVDENAANEHIKDRKYGWLKRGVDAVKYRPAKRSERWSILPAYSLDGLFAHVIYQGSINRDIFEQFIETQVIPATTPWPGPRSILVMDNASIYRGAVSLPLFNTITNFFSIFGS